MTQDRRSNCMKPNRPPDRGGDVVAVRATGVPEPGPNGQIPAVLIAPMSGCRDESLPTAPPGMPRWRSRKAAGGIQYP